MTKNTSKKIAILKKIAIVPILAGLIYFFCVEVVAKEKTISVNQDAVSAENTNVVELDNSAISDKRRDTYYSGVYVKIKDIRKDTIIKINKIYEDLTLKEKRYYLSWVPDKINPKKVSEELFNKLSNTNKEAVWIDGKAVKNLELKKHKPSDFKYYTRRFIDKKVRLKQFPQEYQYTLYTNDYFDKNLKNSHLRYERDTLKTAIIEYQEAIRRHPNKLNSNSQEKNSTVTEASYFKGVRFIFRDGGKNGKVIIDKLYEELTKEDKQKLGKFAFLIPKPFQKISPTQKEIEDFKNSKKYAIWIDGKHVPNETLSKYKPNEIAHFSGSVILKNARSKKFPQPFQYWFSTHKYFEDTKMGVQQTKYGGDKMEGWRENKNVSKEQNWENKKRDYAYDGMTITIIDKKNNINFTKLYNDIDVELKQKYLHTHMFYLRDKKTPTRKLFNDFKNKEKYLIFLDDHKIENIALNNMNVNDIYYYAKMVNPPTSPREYLYFIYSKDFYEKTLQGKIKDKFKSNIMKIIIGE